MRCLLFCVHHRSIVAGYEERIKNNQPKLAAAGSTGTVKLEQSKKIEKKQENRPNTKNVSGQPKKKNRKRVAERLAAQEAAKNQEKSE